jgi:protein required for attachment to host cells
MRNREQKVLPGVHLVEIAAAPPAPAHSGSGARHHTGAANPDGRRLVEDDFAAATAAFLSKLSLDGTIEHLVVVSDPRTLGEMREHFHRDLRGKIIRSWRRTSAGVRSRTSPH